MFIYFYLLFFLGCLFFFPFIYFLNYCFFYFSCFSFWILCWTFFFFFFFKFISVFGCCFFFGADFLFFFFFFFFCFCFLNLICKQTYDSWRLGHVVPDDVVIADIGDQELDIILHGPESAHKNDIGKTFTHTSIPIHPCTLLKQTKSKTLNSLNMTPSFTCPLPVQRGGGRRTGALQMLLGTAPRRRPSRLGQY